jgi:NAD(P)-dependent dehydrogenase (short-subunit alcohol dehydrogenase family)
VKLAGRVAVVTGAGRGIGKAIALAFAREGAGLVLIARTQADLDAVAAESRLAGAEARAHACDVAEFRSVDALASDVLAREGHVDVLVHAAGIYGPIGPAIDTDADQWAKAITVNLIGTFNVCRAFLPAMVEQRRGKVMVLGGGGATSPLPNFTAYAASKAGSVRLAETLAEELQGANVQVNAIAPGLVDTSLQDQVLAAGERAGPLLEKIRAARESGAGAVPAELAAELAVFLASDESGSLTGKLIAAPHDPWRDWAGQDTSLNDSQLYTIRRLDPFTLRSVAADQ